MEVGENRWVKLLRGDLYVCRVCGQISKINMVNALMVLRIECTDFDGQEMDCEYRWKTREKKDESWKPADKKDGS